ncbi:MAG: quinolinate synthase NadA [Bacteroidetes bacterium]|nr:quinolinate synthase NadA [Bacteroidota bacterium]
MGLMKNTEIENMVSEIRKLKRIKNAVVLAHYYMSPELQVLEKDGGIMQAENIIFCGVKFMAETAKILNGKKHVLLPNQEAGCSLASSITANDILELKKTYPGVPVIAYVNTYAETKAECDICCTSRNALAIAKSFDAQRLIFVPDVYMGQNLRQRIEEETGKELILWHGTCEVHEQFTGLSMEGMKLSHPEAEVLMHWEVPKETVDTSFHQTKGVLGSTNDILRYVGESHAKQFILASECDLGATLKGMYPDKEFITPCIKCPYMKKISLTNTLQALKAIGTPDQANYEIILPDDVMEKAYTPIKRMLDFV